MASTSTPKQKTRLHAALANVPAKFRDRIVEAYLDLKTRHTEAKYDAAGISTGKLCETVLRLLQHEVFGKSTPFGTKIPNFAGECQKLIASPKSSGSESQRVILPRALLYLYTIRNKRGIGHVGGDVDANRIDSATMARVADWVMAELTRIYHKLSLEEAQDLLDSLATRNLPLVWEVGSKKRILQPELSAAEKTLLLLYHEPDSAVPSEDLADWVQYSGTSMYRRRVLDGLHDKVFVEYDRESEIVHLSPTGAEKAEKLLQELRDK